MRITRRQLIATATAIGTTVALTGARAQSATYPNRPIRLIVPNPAGGGTDTFARILATSLSEQLGQPVVIDNRVGSSGFVAAAALLQAPPDGHTLFMVYSGILTVNPAIFKGRIRYDPLKDFVGIAPVAEVPNLLVVNSSLPVKNVAELIALAKRQPGQLSYASSGNGVSNHLAMELFKQMAGVSIVHIPYRGDTPAITDLLGGQVQLGFANMAGIGPHLKNPKLRVLAAATSTRVSTLPDVPTVSESGLPGYDMRLWYGLVAREGTPREIVEKLNNAVRTAQQSPEIKARFDGMGVTAMIQTPAEFRMTVTQELQKWSQVVEKGKITTD